jgi:hypothetical protein
MKRALLPCAVTLVSNQELSSFGGGGTILTQERET